MSPHFASQSSGKNPLASLALRCHAGRVKLATLLATIATAASLASLAVSLHAVRVARHTEAATVPPSAHVGAPWTAADESAVAILLPRPGSQLGGYLASLRKGTARHGFTEAQVMEALARQRRAQDWAAATNLAARLAK